ncbi:MAG TPA: hydroxyacid dehydrogenase [Thermomicrobiaceae bacterium]|nr:hydroxyacid dehydrogenase [Thermomicrobiaceae bacterium]
MAETARPRVLVCDPLDEHALEILRHETQVDVRTGLTQDELIDIVAAFDALVVRSATQVTSEVLEAASALRVVARAGVGVDNIDVDAASERGVLVVNAPGASSQAVAELTVGLILSLLRRIPTADRTMKAGRWEKAHLRGREFAGKTLGVIGYGRIGHEVAGLARAFGARVLVYTVLTRPIEHGQAVSFEELLAESDIITIHVNVTDRAASLIDAAAIARMKDGVYLINTSRGGIIDEAALLEGLESGKVGGVGLDVFVDEPPGASALVKHPHVVCTPHIGAATAEAQRAVGAIAAHSLLAVLRGERPDTIVNPYAQ